jgi:hypothetical protein
MIRRYLSSYEPAEICLFVVMVSVVFQQSDELILSTILVPFVANLVMVFCLLAYWYRPLTRLATISFVLAFGALFSVEWMNAANHTWLALWLLIPLLILPEWWRESLYLTYIRYTLALVMFAAAVQKVIAGTYLDGSYIAWLSYHGSVTERALGFLCTEPSLDDSCTAFVMFGTAAIVWQLAVAVALVCDWRRLEVIAMELGFLAFVGLYADELNFQVLVCMFLCIMFKTKLPYVMYVFLLMILILDLFTLDFLITHVGL